MAKKVTEEEFPHSALVEEVKKYFSREFVSDIGNIDVSKICAWLKSPMITTRVGTTDSKRMSILATPEEVVKALNSLMINRVEIEPDRLVTILWHRDHPSFYLVKANDG